MNPTDRTILAAWLANPEGDSHAHVIGTVAPAVRALLAHYDVRGELVEGLCERVAAAAEVIGQRAYREDKRGNLDAAANP